MLTDLQKQHLPSILWLLSKDRRLGKSYLIAYAFIIKSLSNPNRTIYVFDHINTYNNNRIIIDMIREIIFEHNLLSKLTWEFDILTFRLMSISEEIKTTPEFQSLLSGNF